MCGDAGGNGGDDVDDGDGGDTGDDCGVGLLCAGVRVILKNVS